MGSRCASDTGTPKNGATVPDPLAAVFTEALSKPAGPIPDIYAEDYAIELAAIARRVLAQEHADHLRRLADRANCYVDETMLTEEADRA
jgi:hypothetical protein